MESPIASRYDLGLIGAAQELDIAIPLGWPIERILDFMVDSEGLRAAAIRMSRWWAVDEALVRSHIAMWIMYFDSHENSGKMQ